MNSGYFIKIQMKKVSAIITTHNRADLLKRAIESVLNQTYKNMECIVVDDNSTDNTREVCSHYPVQYIYIPKEESHGGNYARNLGIKASAGEYCAFLDDDDYWLPEKTEKQVKLIEEKECELVYCGRRLEIVNKDGTKYEDTLPDPRYYGDMHKKILTVICTTTTCILAKRQALFDVGLFDENLGFWQEYELTIRLAQRKPFYFVNEPLVVYRVNTKDNARLTNKFAEWKKAVKYIHTKHIILYKSLNMTDRLKVIIMTINDAETRSKSSGLLFHSFFYSILLAPTRIRSKIRN